MKILTDWEFHFFDVRGRLGGCSMAFNKNSIRVVNIWGGEGFLGADLISSNINLPLRLTNIYGPCPNREVFWETLLNVDFMQVEYLIIGGDLNFSLGPTGSWETRAPIDPLMTFFELLMNSHDLLNVESKTIMPIWRNKQTRKDTLARRLDQFLIKDTLFARLD